MSWRRFQSCPIISISSVTSNVTRIYSFEVEIPSKTAGLRVRSKIMVNQTRAVDKVRLVKKLGHIPPAIMTHVNRALKLHYSLE